MLAKPIAHLALAYFHQDYDLEYDTPTEALEDYREVCSPDRVDALQEDIRSLLDARTSEKELVELWLNEGLAHYDPRDDGMFMSDWFRAILAILNR
ncbi:hypothetical protein GT346_20015 [Streptomyces sp. SID161]|nr:hypothetical protein [Streptomyces sp. SID161]